MGSGFWGGRDRGHGWDSNRCLLNYGLIQKDAQRSWDSGYRAPKDRIRLTEEGRAFVPKMLEKFGDADENLPLSLTPSQPSQVSQLSQLSQLSQHGPASPSQRSLSQQSGGWSQELLTPRTPERRPRRLDEAFTPTPKALPKKRGVLSFSQSSEDVLGFRKWASEAAAGARRTFRLGSEKQMRLEQLIEELNESGELGHFKHGMEGAGPFRVLAVVKVSSLTAISPNCHTGPMSVDSSDAAPTPTQQSPQLATTPPGKRLRCDHLAPPASSSICEPGFPFFSFSTFASQTLAVQTSLHPT